MQPRPSILIARSAPRRRTRIGNWCSWSSVALVIVTMGITTELFAEAVSLPPAYPAAAMPEPIYWKQNLFLIPYQWSSAADPSAAQAVWLFVSKDHGATWQKISEAKPHVKAFNYHAEADGAYAFAIRTIDTAGRALPEGPHRPELFVVVDTTIPRIEDLAGYMRADGNLELRWRATDANLDPQSLKIEAQLEPSSTWVSVQLTSVENSASYSPLPAPSPLLIGQTLWQPPAGARPLALRATVFDRAGNSAVYQSAISATPIDSAVADPWPTPANRNGDQTMSTVPSLPVVVSPWNHGMPVALPPTSEQVPAANPEAETLGWAPSSATPAAIGVADSATISHATQPATQPWPAGTTAQAPFRLTESAPTFPTDSVTTYGRPEVVDQPMTVDVRKEVPNQDGAGWNRVAVDPVRVDQSSSSLSADRYAMVDNPSHPTFRPLEPFRQASISSSAQSEHAPAHSLEVPAQTDAVPSPSSLNDTPVLLSPAAGATLPTLQPQAATHAEAAPIRTTQLPPGVEPKQVGSRTFALEYELADQGQWGVSRVELWGTRDGGQTWQRFAVDEDHRTPLYVTVDDAGLFGFRIVVEAAGGPAANVPRAGEKPELWVAVDLGRPHAELVSIQPGSGNMADHLLLRWRAADDNLEARPIGLFYSSRPAGPWSAIATSLENTGEYAWRVERFVPSRVYLRLEARDKAGNLAAYQTAEPVALEPSQPTGVIRAVEPVGPTATGADAAYR